MSKLWKLLLVLCAVMALLFAVGCGDDDDDDNDDEADDDDNDVADDDVTDDDDDDNDDDDDDADETLTMSTYNAGLAYGFVQYGDLRRDEIFAALPDLDANVLCMQEVWTEEDINDLTTAMATGFPYTYRHDSVADFADAPAEDEARCGDLTSLDECVQANCDITDRDELLDCVIDNCALRLLATGLDCVECLAGNIDKPYQDMIDQCIVPNPPPLSYSGSNGVLLYSDLELTDSDWLQLDFFLTVRVALYSKIMTELGPVHLLCTHLTAAISILPYNGDYASYEAEQAAQIDALLDWVGTKAGDEPIVLMGDFNTGPGTGGGPDEFLANYQSVLNAGYVDPYTAQNPDLCTYCDDNPLNEDAKAGGGEIIDHVFFKGFDDADFTAVRVLDDPITIDAGDGPFESRLSDHYGVSVEETRPLD